MIASRDPDVDASRGSRRDAIPDFLAALAPVASSSPRRFAPRLERERPYRGMRRCVLCRHPFTLPLGDGRPPRYCRPHRAGRLRAQAARLRAAGLIPG